MDKESLLSIAQPDESAWVELPRHTLEPRRLQRGLPPVAGAV